jgi:hypothetical protein
VNPREGRIHRDDFEAAKDFLQPAAAASGARRIGIDFDAKPEFGKSDGAGGRVRSQEERLNRARSSATSSEVSRISPTGF